MTWSGCDAVPVDVVEPINTGPLAKVEIPETLNWVTDAIPPMTLVDVVANPTFCDNPEAASNWPENLLAVTTPTKYPSPLTQSFDVGLVVPMPNEPLLGIKTKALVPVVARPTEFTPALFAKVRYTGSPTNSWNSTVTPLTPVNFDPSP